MQGSGRRVQGAGFRVQGAEFAVQGEGSQVQGASSGSFSIRGVGGSELERSCADLDWRSTEFGGVECKSRLEGTICCL